MGDSLGNCFVSFGGERRSDDIIEREYPELQIEYFLRNDSELAAAE